MRVTARWLAKIQGLIALRRYGGQGLHDLQCEMHCGRCWYASAAEAVQVIFDGAALVIRMHDAHAVVQIRVDSVDWRQPAAVREAPARG